MRAAAVDAAGRREDALGAPVPNADLVGIPLDAPTEVARRQDGGGYLGPKPRWRPMRTTLRGCSPPRSCC